MRAPSAFGYFSPMSWGGFFIENTIVALPPVHRNGPSCFRGAVQFTVTGPTAGMVYCRGESCRSWSAGPDNAFTLWKPEALQSPSGAENIGTYNKTPESFRTWCKTRGGHLLTEHPLMGLTDVYEANTPTYPYRPGIHVHYAKTRLPIRDGLPKMKDLPSERGGSGFSLSE